MKKEVTTVLHGNTFCHGYASFACLKGVMKFFPKEIFHHGFKYKFTFSNSGTKGSKLIEFERIYECVAVKKTDEVVYSELAKMIHQFTPPYTSVKLYVKIGLD